MCRNYRPESSNAFFLHRFHCLEEFHIVQCVRVFDELPHKQVEVLGRHDHSDVGEDAREMRECDATIVLGYLEG